MNDYEWRIEPGDQMAIRDRFAAAALPAVIQSCSGDPWAKEYPSVEAMFAAKAYRVSDAMMAARDKPVMPEADQ